MVIENRYYKSSKINESKFRQIIRYFSFDFSASDATRLTGISTRSINMIYIKLRYRLAIECEKHVELVGLIEVVESYIGPKRISSNRGRGAISKTIIFVLCKRNGWFET